MDDLAKLASTILQIHIEKGKWDSKIFGSINYSGLDARGAFNKAQTDKILIMLCQYVERLEDRIKELEDKEEKDDLRSSSKK